MDFNVECEQHDSKVHATFTYEYDSEEEKVEIAIEVSRTLDDKLCLSFQRLEGNTIYYKRLVNAVKDEFRYC